MTRWYREIISYPKKILHLSHYISHHVFYSNTRKKYICKHENIAKSSFEDTMKTIFIIDYSAMNNIQKFGLMLLRVLFSIFIITLSLDVFSDSTGWEAFGSHFSFFPGSAYKTIGMIAIGILFIGGIFVFIGALTPIFGALIALILFVLSADGSWTASTETILLGVMGLVLSFTGG